MVFTVFPFLMFNCFVAFLNAMSCSNITELDMIILNILLTVGLVILFLAGRAKTTVSSHDTLTYHTATIRLIYSVSEFDVTHDSD